MRTRFAHFLSQGVLFCLVLSACTDSPVAPARANRAAAVPELPASRREDLARLGREIFRDENLSLRRNQSCAFCHDEA